LLRCFASGIDDKSYNSVFKPVIQKVMDIYRPGAVVLQCGADSLTGEKLNLASRPLWTSFELRCGGAHALASFGVTGDRLGVFNLTLKGKLSASAIALWTSSGANLPFRLQVTATAYAS
jgi:hypothetical protein